MQSSFQKNEKKESEWENIEKNNLDSNSETEYSSICDIWKDCVTSSIRKLESQTPVYLQTYLQVHTEYLHCIDNLFGTCYLWQRQYFDKLGIDKNTINEYGKFCQVLMNEIGTLMDISVNNQKLRSDMYVEIMKTSNQLIRQGIDWHAKIMTNLNSFLDSQIKFFKNQS